MSPQINPKLFDNIEHHMVTASKYIIRGLLAACGGVVLMWMMLARMAPPKVSIPGLELEVPTPIGTFALVLTSTVFGIAAAASVWKVRGLENQLSTSFHLASDKERSQFNQSRAASITRRSPIWGPLAILATTLCENLLHFLYFYLLFGFGELGRDLPLWLSGFWGQAWMSSGSAMFTTAPFWFLYVVHRRHYFFGTINS